MADGLFFPIPSELPSGDLVTFTESTYFQTPNEHDKLPSPAMVLEKAASEHRNSPSMLQRESVPVKFQDLELFVKYGPRVKVNEGQCLWAIRKVFGNQVPVPEVYGWRVQGNQTFLYMRLLKGVTLKESWPRLRDDQKEQLSSQIREIIRTWRKAKQHPETRFIGNLSGQSINDDIFYSSRTRDPGPFTSIRSFHDWFTSITRRKINPQRPPSPHPYRDQMSDEGSITLTHGDVNGLNILVSNDTSPRVVAVIDWEYGGWLPPYWEFCKAASRSCNTGGDWSDVYVPRIFQELPHSIYWNYFVGCLGV